MDKKLAQKLIAKTREDYNKVAAHFSSSRYAFNWPRVIGAIKNLEIKSGSRVLDLGCGNGRAVNLLKSFNIDYVGLDISEELTKIAQKKYPKDEFIVSNLLDTPFSDNKFDYVISLATLHHIPSEEQRLNALKEINRILKPNGTVLITVWYFWGDAEFKKLIKNKKLELGDNDFFKPWKDNRGNILVERYFHAWEKSEMKELLEKAGFGEIILSDNKDDKNNNLIAVAKKSL